MAKRKTIAYILWLFGGFFGLHHFYLGRDRQAFLWWAFCGGYLGFGWFRDLWMIPRYVEEANESKEFVEKLIKKIKKEKTPEVGWIRFSAQLTVAETLGYLVITCIPEELVPATLYRFCYLLVPAGIACGIHFVGNIGRHQGSIVPPLIGAYLTSPLYLVYGTSYMFLTGLVSCYAFNWYSLEWQRKPSKKRSVCTRALILGLAGLLYISAWSSCLYFNTTIEDSDGNSIKFRDAAKHFFKSPLWQEFREVLTLLKHHVRYHGFSQIWSQILKSFDPSGTQNAYKVLNLVGNETPEEITSQYRKLARQWHPDKHKEPEMKKVAQEKFINIQEAYNILSNMKAQRKKRNKEDREL